MTPKAKSTTLSKTFFERSSLDADLPAARASGLSSEEAPRKSRPMGQHYMFRVECPGDADIVRALLVRSLLSWNQETFSGWPDTDVSFVIKPGGPTLQQMQWLIDHVTDCHVISETLAPAAEYTGERSFRLARCSDGIRPPPKRVVSTALEGLQAYLDSLESMSETMRETAEILRGE